MSPNWEPEPLEREDEQQRDRWDDGLDPWGYPEQDEETETVRLGEE